MIRTTDLPVRPLTLDDVTRIAEADTNHRFETAAPPVLGDAAVDLEVDVNVRYECLPGFFRVRYWSRSDRMPWLGVSWSLS